MLSNIFILILSLIMRKFQEKNFLNKEINDKYLFEHGSAYISIHYFEMTNHFVQ